MIAIDYKDRRPLYEQVVERYRELILNQVLEPDSKLPSVRSLAMELSITPNTIQRAYSELEKAGYIYTVKGRGNFVSSNDSLMELNRTQNLEDVKTAVHAAKSVGLPQKIILEAVEFIYGGATYDTNSERQQTV